MLLARAHLQADVAVLSLESGPIVSPACILVVDDEPKVRNILVSTLMHSGCSVMSACDGQEAIDIFRREADTIDCLLLDLSMLKLGGDEVFEQL